MKPIYIAAAALMAFALSSCKPRILTQTQYRDRIEYRDRTLVDSVYNRDTVLIKTQGDTVFSTIIRWRVKVKTKTDSVYLTKTDSVTIYRKAPAAISPWQKLKAAAFPYAAALLLILAAYTFWPVVAKFILPLAARFLGRR